MLGMRIAYEAKLRAEPLTIKSRVDTFKAVTELTIMRLITRFIFPNRGSNGGQWCTNC